MSSQLKLSNRSDRPQFAYAIYKLELKEAFAVYKKVMDIFIAWMEFAKWNRFCFWFWFCTPLDIRSTHGKHETYNVSMMNEWHLSKYSYVCASLSLSLSVNACSYLVWTYDTGRALLSQTNRLFFIPFLLGCAFMVSSVINFICCGAWNIYHTFMELWNIYENNVGDKTVCLCTHTHRRDYCQSGQQLWRLV